MTMSRKEIKFYQRRITIVVSYFDEGNEIPWHYVQRTGDGRFEAIAAQILDDEMKERSLGVFATQQVALMTLYRYRHEEKRALFRDIADDVNEMMRQTLQSDEHAESESR